MTTPTNSWISPRYGEALQWADELHRPQRRKGKLVPYISHLISVSARAWEDGGSEDQAIAALLNEKEPKLTALEKALWLKLKRGQHTSGLKRARSGDRFGA